ncbi:hypothetical protein C5S32_04525 [ANME-1 cluster archaeon GoMg1]|nr:hypothetical protein [ANME-1 cluster archaeon GoMg1]
MGIERKRKTTINSNLRHIKIYLDTNVWCRPFDGQTQQRIIDEGEAFLKILEKVHTERKYKIKVKNPIEFIEENGNEI